MTIDPALSGSHLIWLHHIWLDYWKESQRIQDPNIESGPVEDVDFFSWVFLISNQRLLFAITKRMWLRCLRLHSKRTWNPINWLCPSYLTNDAWFCSQQNVEGNFFSRKFRVPPIIGQVQNTQTVEQWNSGFKWEIRVSGPNQLSRSREIAPKNDVSDHDDFWSIFPKIRPLVIFNLWGVYQKICKLLTRLQAVN